MDSNTQQNDQGMHHLSSFGRKYFDLVEFDPNEQLLLEIRKHPFGLFLIYFAGIFVGITLLATSIILVSIGFFDSLDLAAANPIAVLVGYIMAMGSAIVTVINGYLYRHNVIYVTNEKIAQVVNVSIFHRKVSQLGIGDAQDVTVTQKTFFSRIFNFGTLVIETAGEQQNYTFDYVPDPYRSSKIIIGSHESNLQKYGN